METENQGQSVGEQVLFPYYDNLYHLRSNKELSLEEVYNLVKGNALRHVTGEIRRAIAEGNPVKAKSLKMQLPCIAVSCRFPEERRTEEAGDYLGYVLVDTDGLTCPAAEYRDRCAAIPFVAFAQVSASGNGNHLVAASNAPRKSTRTSAARSSISSKPPSDTPPTIPVPTSPAPRSFATTRKRM